MNAHGLPDDLDDALYAALMDTVGQDLAYAATEAVSQVLASRRDALADMLQPLPAPPRTMAAAWLIGPST